MKNFLSTTKGKIIAGAVTLAVIAGVIVLIILLNTGYRNIRVADLTGTSRVTSMLSVSDAFKGQNLKSGESVEVLEKSSLTLALDSDKHVVASELTKFSVEAFGAEGKDTRTIIRLEKGTISNQIDNKLLPSESYVVESPNASMSVRGTIFTVNVYYDNNGRCHTSVEVNEGTVELAEKDTGKVKTLNAGQKANVVSRTNREPDRIPTTSSDIKPGGGDSGSSVQKLTFGDFEYIYNETLGGIEITKYKGSDETVSIPAEIEGEKVVKIGEAFNLNRRVTSVTIPQGVKEIGEKAFYNCPNLKSVNLPDTITSIGPQAFAVCSEIESFTIPDGVTKIEMSTFEFCYKLSNVTLPEGITKICGGAFASCWKLTSIDIPDSVTVIEYRAFERCEALTTVIIPDGVTEIGSGAFAFSYNISNVTLPDSVVKIGEDAFMDSGATVTFKGKTYTEDNFDELYTEQ